MVNKSVKVYSQDYHDKAENYTFKWDPPMDPNNDAVHFDLKNDMLIFTPTVEGDYQIHLSIADISDEVVAEDIFYYRAVAETLEVAIVAEPKPEKKAPELTSVVKNTKKKNYPYNKNSNRIKTPKESTKQNNKPGNTENVHFTIQVAAWPSLEQARMDQVKLIDEGIDAYIQRHYRKGKDAVWYRVRVGNFTKKDKAQEIQKQIEKITGEKSWMDVMPAEKK